MASNQVIIPAPSRSEGYVELARTRDARGRLFKKHILNLGELIHPATGEKLQLDDSFYDRLKANFESGVCDIVQVPLADAQNKHSEDPARNIGEVIGLDREGGKVYAMIDARDPEAADKLGKTLLGVSAMLNLNYTDTRTGKRVGPALLHACVTNRPYVTGLDDYEEVLAASNTADADETTDVLLAVEESPVPTKEELLEQLKSEHGVDVEALQATAAKSGDLSQLTAALTAALQGTSVELAGGQSAADEEIKLTDVVAAIAELAQHNRSQGDQIGQLMRGRAEQEIDGYVGTGRVLPKQRDAFVELALTDRSKMEVLLPDEPVVKLNHQAGQPGTPQGEGQHTVNVDEEVKRLAAQAQTSHFFTPQAARNGSARP